MKINDTDAASSTNPTEDKTLAPHVLTVRLTSSSSRLAATTAAGNALAGSVVSLAFFRSRKPLASFDRHHAKFRA